MLILPNRFLSLLRKNSQDGENTDSFLQLTSKGPHKTENGIRIAFTVRSNLLTLRYVFSRTEQLLKTNRNKCGRFLPLGHLICFQLCVCVCCAREWKCVGFVESSVCSLCAHTHMRAHSPRFYSILTSCPISWQDWGPPIDHTSSRLFHMWK